MNSEGHAGLSLLVVSSIFYILQLYDYSNMLTVLLIVGFSTLPDIDLRWEIPHRKYTHNIAAALVFGLAVGALTYQSLGFLPGFYGGFFGTILHIVGDVLTYRKFKPLWPFSNIRVGLGLFRSSNKMVNRVFLLIGVLVFTLYLSQINISLLK